MSHQRIHPIVRFAVERRVTMGMLVVALLVLGWLSVQRLPLEFLPTISSSNVSVRVGYRSASPEEIARRIVQPLEDSLGTLDGIEQMTSSASADAARIDLTFVDDTDMDLANVEVRDRVDRVRHLLPDDLRQLTIRRFQTSDLPVLRALISSTWSQDQLYEFAEQELQPRLERLAGVAQIELRGLRSRQVSVQLDPDRLQAHGVSLRELSALLRDNHLNISAGHIDEGNRELQVRLLGELETLEDVRRLPIKGGLRLADVATIGAGYPEQEEFNVFNGHEALTLRVYKTSTANLLAVADRVKAELAQIKREPAAAGLDTRIFRDASIDVRQGIGQLRSAGLIGGGLAVLAVFLFLRRVRTTLLVGIAIPVSVVFTFVLMYFVRVAGWAELTLNVVSLMGLVLALGMLVDNSIVVIESIFRHAHQLGEDAKMAALYGASEVALPIVASTGTTLCVFIPVVFLTAGGGFFSRYLFEIGLTVCIVMVASLLVALTVVPMAAAILLTHEVPRQTPWIDRLGQVYVRMLRFTLRFRLAFFVAACVLLWGSWQLFSSIERTFSSRTVERQVTVYVDTPRNYTLQQTRDLFVELSGIIAAQRSELDIADFSYEYHAGGGRSRGGFGRQRKIDLYLQDESVSRLSTVEVRDRVRALMPTHAGVELRIGQARSRHGSSTGVEVALSGDDQQVLELLADQVAASMAAVVGVEDVDSSLESGDDEVRVSVDRQRALQSDLSSRDVASTVQGALSNRAAAYLKTDDREIELVMRYRDDQRQTLEQLQKMPVRTAGLNLPLGSLASFVRVAGPSAVARENRQAKITLTANTSSPRMTMMAMRGVGQALAGLRLPTGYSWSFGRWSRMNQRDQAGADFALLFSLLLVYMLMAAFFESFTQPLAIMFSVPFAFIGVGLVMKIFSQPRDNNTQLGFLILIGVVVNNAIVLVDHINRLRRQGLSREQAILDGGRHRLRAILMTAVTTILGLMPMVAPFLFPQWFGTLEGRAASWAPVGLVILGGLTTSTFLTLMIVPTLYSVVDDIGRFWRRVVRLA